MGAELNHDIPDSALSLFELIWMKIQERRLAPALMEYPPAGELPYISYEQLGSMLVRLQSFLEEQGITAGSRVVLLRDGGFDALAADLSLLGTGAVMIPLRAEELAEDLADIRRLFRPTHLWIRGREDLERLGDRAEGLQLLSLNRIRDEIPHCQWLRQAKSTLESRLEYLEKMTETAVTGLVQIQKAGQRDGQTEWIAVDAETLKGQVEKAFAAAPFKRGNIFASQLHPAGLGQRVLCSYLPLYCGAAQAHLSGDDWIREAAALDATILIRDGERNGLGERETQKDFIERTGPEGDGRRAEAGLLKRVRAYFRSGVSAAFEVPPRLQYILSPRQSDSAEVKTIDALREVPVLDYAVYGEGGPLLGLGSTAEGIETGQFRVLYSERPDQAAGEDGLRLPREFSVGVETLLPAAEGAGES